MENNQQTETTQTEETEVKEQKTYTSEEVSAIVQKRLASYRKSATKDFEAEYQEKLSTLEKREKAFILKSALSERGMSQELSGIISFTDETDLNSKLDQLQAIYGANEEKEDKKGLGFQPIGSPPGENKFSKGSDPIREAFKPKP